MTPYRSLSTAGFCATAICFGPGRVGFGLFVPELRSVFSMSTSVVGYVSSLGFLGFFLALGAAQSILTRRGPEAPVLAGLIAAALGTTLVAAAPNLAVLATGVFFATSSAGFVWTPFNDAVHRKVRDTKRPSALSRISTGTSVGAAAAGLTALVTVRSGLSWRTSWAGFAAAAALAWLANWAPLRRVERAEASPEQSWRALLGPASVPLFVIGFVFGTTSAIYISFAADRLVEVGGIPGASPATIPALVFVFYGLFGLNGLFTDRVKDTIGLTWLLRALMLAGALSLAVVGALPYSWASLIVSAGLQGVHVMMTSAVLAFWSERLFPAMPSLGFTAAVLAAAAGNVLGPAVAGAASDAFGGGAMFLGAAALPMLTAILLRERRVTEQPARAL